MTHILLWRFLQFSKKIFLQNRSAIIFLNRCKSILLSVSLSLVYSDHMIMIHERKKATTVNLRLKIQHYLTDNSIQLINIAEDFN